MTDVTESARPLIVEDGRILAYRLFDVGDAIALDVAEGCVSQNRAKQRVKIAPEKGPGMSFTSPPLDVPLGSVRLELSASFQALATQEASASGAPGADARSSVEATVVARLYEYGAASVRFDLVIPPSTDVSALVPLCDHLYDAPELDAQARKLLEAFLPELGPALEGGHSWRELESYTVIFVRALRGAPTPAEVLASPDLVRLVVGERSRAPLSEGQRTDVLQHAQSYFADDLVVVDWNSAFVLEPSGSRDVPDILELANSQLLELRYYDDLLDVELQRIYDDFAEARRKPLRLLWSPYGRLARSALRRFVEVTEFTERVDNALKVVGDFYLARIYAGALRRLRIAAWQASVDRKMLLVEKAYGLAKGEIEIRRSVLLEVIVIALILFELLAAIRGGR